jgi:hypothetical protein
MRKIAIGICFLLSGIITDLALVFSAVTFLPHLTAWSTAYPSKLMFLIFAGKSRFSDGADGLGLGLFFSFGILLIILGTAILLKEYFSGQSKTVK